MYCPSCGSTLSQRTRYCSRCGARLIDAPDDDAVASYEDRLRTELVDIFWVTVIGLALILGGMVVIRKWLELGDWVLVTYVVVSSAAFAINFGLSLWQIARLSRRARGTGELGPAPAPLTLDAPSSVVEITTRRLEPDRSSSE